LAGKARDESARKRQLSGLKPVKPGEIRNPTGKNQWSTVRGEFERQFAEAAGPATPALVALLLRRALRADPYFFGEALARLMPKIEKRELSGDVSVNADLSALEARLARAARARGTKRDPGDPDAT
jgi:hypothetical protein